jgi:hypothetical protein
MRRVDVFLLPPLRAASQKNNQLISVAAKIDPITWTSVDPLLQYSTARAFYVRHFLAQAWRERSLP